MSIVLAVMGLLGPSNALAEGEVSANTQVTYASAITVDRFYSKYDPSKFNNTGSTPSIGSYTNLIQYRLNCYGYAFGYILEGSVQRASDGGYKQQPGEFATTSSKSQTVYNIVRNNPTASMINIIKNVKLDAARRGYTVTEYQPTSNTVAQYGTSSRLVAVVTGNTDYHFYMQHSDGTWSHKPGSAEVTNKSIATNIALTNSNIKAKANEGIYAGGQLKFLIITKNAVVDHPHAQRCCDSRPCSHNQTTFYLREQGPDYLQNARNVTTGTISAKFDFERDHDVYCYTPASTRTYTLTISCIASPSSDVDCLVYDGNSNLLQSYVAVGAVSKTITLTKDQKYYFDVYDYNHVISEYTFSIS